MDVSSVNGVGKMDGHIQRVKLDHYLTLDTKINSKWIKALTIRSEAIKLPKENTGSKLLDIDLGDDFFNPTPKAKTTNKWTTSNPFTAKQTLNRMKKQPTE